VIVAWLRFDCPMLNTATPRNDIKRVLKGDVSLGVESA
jgi:hypothetical protein